VSVQFKAIRDRCLVERTMFLAIRMALFAPGLRKKEDTFTGGTDLTYSLYIQELAERCQVRGRPTR
jgi:hypothetical protein